jgi:hypothetical protein
MAYDKKIAASTTRILLIAALIISSILISSCQTFGGSRNANTNYYQGTRGLQMEIEQGMPPSRLYYYGDADDNTFDIGVKVQNRGSSYARGGIFLSGYDPQMIQIDGIIPDPSRSRACQIDIGNIGFGSFGGVLRCDNFNLALDRDGIRDIQLLNLFCPGGSYANRNDFDITRVFGSGACTDFRYTNNGVNQRWDIDFGNPDIDIEYANHGRLLIANFQGLDFSRTFGVEYLLAGNTYEFPGGETTYVNFDGNIVSWPPGLDSTQQTFLITNCYLYATYAAPVVCIDPSPFSESRKVCTPRQFTGTSGQGAPVAVTLIEQENTPRQSIFTIHVKNVGAGRVYDPGHLEICSPYSPVRVSGNSLNVVYVGDIRVSGDLQRLDCSPNDFIRLDPQTKSGIVTCSYDIPFGSIKSAYEAPLVVELWYGYEETTQRQITIKRAI